MATSHLSMVHFVQWIYLKPKNFKVPEYINITVITEEEIFPVRARVDLTREHSFASPYVFKRTKAPMAKVPVPGILGCSKMWLTWNYDLAFENVYLSTSYLREEAHRGNFNTATLTLGRQALRQMQLLD